MILISIKYSLIRWESGYENAQRQKNLIASTRRFYKQKLLQKVIKYWLAEKDKNKRLETNLRILESRIDSFLIKRTLIFWRSERHRNQDRSVLLAGAISTRLEYRFIMRGDKL